MFVCVYVIWNPLNVSNFKFHSNMSSILLWRHYYIMSEENSCCQVVFCWNVKIYYAPQYGLVDSFNQDYWQHCELTVVKSVPLLQLFRTSLWILWGPLDISDQVSFHEQIMLWGVHFPCSAWNFITRINRQTRKLLLKPEDVTKATL